jgi:hypothetical protein
MIDCLWDADVNYLESIPTSIQRLRILLSTAGNTSTNVLSSPKNLFVGLSGHPMLQLSLSFFSVSMRQGNVLANLPKNLEHLEIALRLVTLEKFLSYGLYPRTLHTLILHPYRFYVNDFMSWDPTTGFKLLPQSLTKLEIYSGVPLIDADIAFLPRTLTHLHLNIWRESYANYDGLEADALERDCAQQGIQIPTKQLTDACAAFLPSELVYLKLEETYFGSAFLQNLPSALSTLDFTEVRQCRRPLAEDSLAMLPQSLTSLILDVYLDASSYGNLPSSLTRLKTLSCWDMRSKHFALLPQALRFLEIGNLSTVGDEDVKALPGQLLELTLPKAELKSTDSLKYLPRSLQVLLVSKIIIPHPRPAKADILAQLPQHLQAYELPWMQKNGKKVDLSTLP